LFCPQWFHSVKAPGANFKEYEGVKFVGNTFGNGEMAASSGLEEKQPPSLTGRKIG